MTTPQTMDNFYFFGEWTSENDNIKESKKVWMHSSQMFIY